MTTTTPNYTLAYQGQLRTAMKHLQSNSEVITDAPVDNHGKGEAFSPTDLMSAALASCVMTIMAIKAGDMGYESIEMEVYRVAERKSTRCRSLKKVTLLSKESSTERIVDCINMYTVFNKLSRVLQCR